MRTRILFGALLTLSLGLGDALLPMAGIETGAVAHAQDGKPPKMNPKVLKPLQEALKLSNEGKYAEAEAPLQKAADVPDKTPFEQYQLDELAGFVAIKQNQYARAAAAYERALQSGLVPGEQVNDRLALLARLYFQRGDTRLDGPR